MSIESLIARAKELQKMREEAAAKPLANKEDYKTPLAKAPEKEKEESKVQALPQSAEGLKNLISDLGYQSSQSSQTQAGAYSLFSDPNFSYNSRQREFITLGAQGNSCVLIGAAGTGKTTAQNGFVRALLDSGKAGTIQSKDHKYLLPETPGIVICAFTRRAVRNIRKRMPAELQGNCITIHKLLEYKREFEQVLDPQTCEMKTIKVFRPARNSFNPLPQDITCIIFEEASMIGTPLFEQYKDALCHPVQEIFLGDLNQIPPVMGKSILGYKLNEFPVVELNQVYRQALESPIISFAHKILAGNPLSKDEILALVRPGFSAKFWGKKTYPENATEQVGSYLCNLYDSGIYDPEEDVILTPQNVGFGTIELNRHLADHIARKRNATTFEIIAGFKKIYLSAGDRVLYEKEEAIVQSIVNNSEYRGVRPQDESPNLNYWGHKLLNESTISDSESEELSEDELFEALGSMQVQEEKVNKASHRVTLLLLESDEEVVIDTTAELNAIEFSYCMTAHKAQGSEWRKVWFITHHSQSRMWSRELLYTAVTRAKEELNLLVEPNTFVNGIKNQRIKGNTWQEKAMAFLEQEGKDD